MSRRRGRRRSGLPIIIILAVLLLLVITFGVVFLKFNNSRMLVGTWSRTYDVSPEISDYIDAYLKDAALGPEVNSVDYLPMAPIKVVLSINADGTFETHVDEDSYNECLKIGREALKESIKELMTKRLEISYVETDKDVDTLINEAVGMDLDSYLDSYGPEVLSPIENFRAQHNYKGYYKSDRDYLYVTDVLNLPINGELSNEYLISNGTLVINFAKGAYVYTREN